MLDLGLWLVSFDEQTMLDMDLALHHLLFFPFQNNFMAGSTLHHTMLSIWIQVPS